MNTLLCAIGVAALTVTALVPHQAVSSTLGTFEGITASGDFECGERVRLRLDAKSADVFASEGRMTRFAGNLRALLGFECPEAEAVMLEGYAGGTRVYRGVTSESGGWSLLTMEAPDAGDTGEAEAVVMPVLPRAQADDSDAAASAQGTFVPLPDLNDGSGVPKAETPTVTASTDDGDTALGELGRIQDSVAKGSFNSEGYNFSGLMTLIHLGRLDEIHDGQATRGVVVSLHKAFNQNCGERGADVGLAVMFYGFPQMREMQRNPAKIFEQTLGPIAEAMRRMQQGDMRGGMEGLLQNEAQLVTEGVQDGRLFVSRHGCSGTEFNQFINNMERLILTRSERDPVPDDEIEFSALMSPAFRARLGIPDPAVARRERKLAAARDDTTRQCTARFGKGDFCGCLVTELAALSLSDDDWTRLAGDFGALPTLARDIPGSRQAVRSCNR